jgi:hypothetical protein
MNSSDEATAPTISATVPGRLDSIFIVRLTHA